MLYILIIRFLALPLCAALPCVQQQSNTKIMIRGKGATKEGKLGRTGLPQPGEDEPLHALITGQTPETVKCAVDKVSSSEPALSLHGSRYMAS